ncbi:MAG: hypothetical protein Q9184_001923, partial [Pyrenodesmia sp. 2 TL-2023]
MNPNPPPNAPAGPSNAHQTLNVDISQEPSYPVIPAGVNPQFPRGQGHAKMAPARNGQPYPTIDPWYWGPHEVIILIERVIMESHDIKQVVCKVYTKMMKNLGWFGPTRLNPMRMFLCLDPAWTFGQFRFHARSQAWNAAIVQLRSRSACYQRFMQVTNGMMGNIQGQQNALDRLEGHVPYPGQL